MASCWGESRAFSSLLCAHVLFCVAASSHPLSVYITHTHTLLPPNLFNMYPGRHPSPTTTRIDHTGTVSGTPLATTCRRTTRAQQQRLQFYKASMHDTCRSPQARAQNTVGTVAGRRCHGLTTELTWKLYCMLKDFCRPAGSLVRNLWPQRANMPRPRNKEDLFCCFFSASSGGLGMFASIQTSVVTMWSIRNFIFVFLPRISHWIYS